VRILIASIASLLFVTTASAANFVLTSTAFQAHKAIPVLYTCDGKNISPPFHWENSPANTRSYVFIETGTEWASGDAYKWIIYNLPGTLTDLLQGADEDLPGEAMTGMNTFHDAIYRGPCPPDSRVRNYSFTLYALDAMLPLDEKADVDDVMAAMKHHILAQTVLIGYFQH
jgi:Raf kinase inhibitor-like YbhB/YbcL family protein